MKMLWLVKLYWIWIVLGLIILIPAVIPPGLDMFNAFFGFAVVVVGLVFRRAMQSDTLRQRIDRNLNS
ncbi:hypothetical protein L6Q79_09645 [bacterium]|nr:hypothetical protein [bacterium]NUN45272.1 hypothetical protein [bacterium]HMW33877.1 hypothetical protein [bacterium]HMW35413.1 hypothetical protein [bacterium]HMY35085.1 hypothetical protein [bacterium]